MFRSTFGCILGAAATSFYIHLIVISSSSHRNLNSRPKYPEDRVFERFINKIASEIGARSPAIHQKSCNTGIKPTLRVKRRLKSSYQWHYEDPSAALRKSRRVALGACGNILRQKRIKSVHEQGDTGFDGGTPCFNRTGLFPCPKVPTCTNSPSPGGK